MKATRNKGAAFLQAMAAEPEAPPPASSAEAPAPVAGNSAASRSRAGLKHIGAYLDRATVEKVAILRARLDLDNSELVQLAIEELYARHEAKRSFGDA